MYIRSMELALCCYNKWADSGTSSPGRESEMETLSDGLIRCINWVNVWVRRQPSSALIGSPRPPGPWLRSLVQSDNSKCRRNVQARVRLAPHLPIGCVPRAGYTDIDVQPNRFADGTKTLYDAPEDQYWKLGYAAGVPRIGVVFAMAHPCR